MTTEVPRHKFSVETVERLAIDSYNAAITAAVDLLARTARQAELDQYMTTKKALETAMRDIGRLKR